MKKNLFLIVAILGVSLAYGQEKKDLNSPQFKNFKYFEQAPKASFEFKSVEAPPIKGPVAKNNPLASKDEGEESLVVSRQFYRDLKGPRAKNLKPWKD